jgi:hypothetical protein
MPDAATRPGMALPEQSASVATHKTTAAKRAAARRSTESFFNVFAS